MKKLSILIPTLESRKEYLSRLMDILNPQLNDYVEVLIESDSGEQSIGTKRNALLDKSTGEYIAFVDDDDIVADYYVEEILKAIDMNPDVVGIHLLHYEDGIHTGLTHHSLKYDHWWEERNTADPNLMNYYRNPNHLNPVKREYAISVKFPQINHGEDKHYSMNLLNHLKSEVYIEHPIYVYLFRTKK